MPVRDRYRELGPLHLGGRADPLKAGLVTEYGTNKMAHRQHMIDFVGNYASTNPLEYHSDDWTVGWFSGENSAFWRCESWLQYHDAGGWALSGLPSYSDSVAATMALARSNPSRPTLDVWNFLWELKDIPRMVKQIGDLMRKYGPNPSKNWPRSQSLIKDIGSSYLGWTFGWDQLRRDLGTILDFVAQVEKRTQELDQLKAGDLRRTVTLINMSDQVTRNNAFYCGPLYQSHVRVNLRLTRARKQWVRVRYAPTAQTFKMLGKDHSDLARSLAFGHVPDFSTVWNAIPWTWLLDWFSTAGDYFAANRNRLGVRVDDIAIMRHTALRLASAELSNPRPSSTFVENKGYHWEQKLRSRYVGGPVIEAFVPYLGANHWSILAALATKYL